MTKREKAIQKAAVRLRFSDTVVRLCVNEYQKAMRELPREKKKTTKK